MNIKDILKKDDGSYKCLENNKDYKTFDGLQNILNTKYKMTIIDYAIKWKLVKEDEYIKCEICKSYCDSIGKHLSIKHKEFGGLNNYKSVYGNDIKTLCNNYSNFLKNKMIGINNHNHKNNTTKIERQEKSPFSIEFWKKKFKNKSIVEIELILESFRNSALSEREFTNQLEYWLNKGYNEEESIKLLKDRQTTFSLNKCIEKFGEIEGNIIFNKRQDKWLDSLLNNGKLNIGYSEISQVLFDSIKKLLPNNNFYYGSYNNELRLKYNNSRTYLYDFADINNKKIIEFHGDLFHGNPLKFKATDNPNPFKKNITAQEMWDKDKIKYDIAKNNGYDILIIWESEFKSKGTNKKEEVIQKCVNFINNVNEKKNN